jgi:hypothetical protein
VSIGLQVCLCTTFEAYAWLWYGTCLRHVLLMLVHDLVHLVRSTLLAILISGLVYVMVMVHY